MRVIFLFLLTVLLTGCSNESANYPHGKYNSRDNIYFSSFSQQPKTLDPAVSYSSDEAVFVAQVVEPPLQYHFLKRPYVLVPLTAQKMPQIRYIYATEPRQVTGRDFILEPALINKFRTPLDYYCDFFQSEPQNFSPCFDSATQIMPGRKSESNFKPFLPTSSSVHILYTVYRIQIQPHIFYQPHPAFATLENGQYRYLNFSTQELAKYHDLRDFKYTGTRELTADDYVYEIKRLASPLTNSPIQGLMSTHIPGFDSFAQTLQQHYQPGHFLDLRKYPLDAVKTIDRYTYEITINGVFKQFPYWLAMSFFGPVPWEADQLYSSSALQKNNIGFSTYPVGTGPYMIQINNPNSEIVMQRNPNFHLETYPTEGEPDDVKNGYLKNAGKRLPFVDTFLFSLEKESIPGWVKFLQGYYDSSGIGADNFAQAIQINNKGQPLVSPELAKQDIRLRTALLPTISYFAFNMKDPIVGGYGEAQKKLRQAIAIAINTEEFISIFLNGRGQIAYSPIPPGIFGFNKQLINPYTTDWYHAEPHTKSLAYAKKLLAEAGYPNGINAKTGNPLILYYDAISGLGADERAQYQWMQNEFAQLGIQLIIRDSDYNRFQDKISTGNVQIFAWGWSADYPDPENFLFTLYGPNGQLVSGGENPTNYDNPKFNQLFTQMINRPNDAERRALIDEMVSTFQEDTPWFGILYGESYVLGQHWVTPNKINGMANNTLKYIQLNPKERATLQKQWNRAQYGYLLIVLIVSFLSFVPFILKYRKMQRQPPKKVKYEHSSK
ncbi:MAG: ABC transporter substrate-binding protein [Legionellales bacterium]|nr:ABC transporter substrate-binding protein [Legionellales bacterium]